jgi:hypothetical protein
VKRRAVPMPVGLAAECIAKLRACADAMADQGGGRGGVTIAGTPDELRALADLIALACEAPEQIEGKQRGR